MSLGSTDLGTDTGRADDGEEGVSFRAHRHLQAREALGELLLILLSRTNRVHKHLEEETGGTGEERTHTGGDG